MFNNQIPFQATNFALNSAPQQSQSSQFYPLVQYQFQQPTQTKPKWAMLNPEPTPVLKPIVNTLLTDLNDEHFNRHIENIQKHEDDDENFPQSIEDHEEINAEKLTKLLTSKKVETKKNEEEDDDEDLNTPDEEPKVFQDEDEVDLIPTTSNPVILSKTVKPEPVVSFKPAKQAFFKQEKRPDTTSVMPTPLAYSRSSSLTSLNSFDVKSIHSEVASEYSHMPVKCKPMDNSQLNILNDEDEPDEEEEIDNLMPESPAAPDSSFLKAQRLKHKQQQVEYRQNAAAAAALLPLASGINLNQQQPIKPTKPWQVLSQTTNNPELTSIMSRLTLNKPELESPSSSNAYISSLTPPVKLVQTPKFVNTNQQPQQQQQPPVMSVTYAFMKNSQNYMQPNPPKFLMSSMQFKQPTNPIIIPKSPPTLNYASTLPSEEIPHVYATETRSIFSRQHKASGPSSPQESICSRMSDASIPSVIKQDLTVSTQRFKTVLNQGTILKNLPATTTSNFKALFQKIQTSNPQYEIPLSSSSSSASSSSTCSSVVRINNIQPREQNTPAGFESEKEQDESVKENSDETNNGLFIDFDLENFIKENFQPAKSMNTSYDESDFSNRPSSRSFKRASLQSLDLSNRPVVNSKQTNSKLNTSTTSKSNLATKPIKKRLSEDNSLNINLKNKPKPTESTNTSSRLNRNNSHSVNSHTTNVTTNLPVSSSSLSISHPTSKLTQPNKSAVVQTTKTVQLRASKLAVPAKKPVPTKTTVAKPVVSSLASKQIKTRENILKQTSSEANEKLNQTINTENVFGTTEATSSTANSYHQHLSHLNRNNERRKSFSFGSSISKKETIPKKPVEKPVVPSGITKPTTSVVSRTSTLSNPKTSNLQSKSSVSSSVKSNSSKSAIKN